MTRAPDTSASTAAVPADVAAAATARGLPPLAPAGYHRFDTLAEHAAAFAALLARACRTVDVFDIALGPAFDRPAHIDRLRDFLAADRNNRVRIVLHDARSASRDCPRLCALLRRHSEAIAIHQTTGAAQSVADPLLVVDAVHALRRFHHAQPRSALYTDDPAGVRPLADRFEQIFEASEPALAATTLGL